MSQYKYIPTSPPIYFTILWCAIFGSVIGFLTARGNMQFAVITTLLGVLLFSLLSSFYFSYWLLYNASIGWWSGRTDDF